MFNQKGVSPLIATILLVAISLAIAGMLYSWMAQYATTQTSKATEQSESKILECGRAGIKINACSFDANVVTLTGESTGDIDLNGFTVIVLLADGNVVQKSDTTTSLLARSYATFDINLLVYHPGTMTATPTLSKVKLVPTKCPSYAVSTTECD